MKVRHEGGVQAERVVDAVVHVVRHAHEPQHRHPEPHRGLGETVFDGLIDLVVGAQQELPLRAAPRDEQGLTG
jgi:hypothetical protein